MNNHIKFNIVGNQINRPVVNNLIVVKKIASYDVVFKHNPRNPNNQFHKANKPKIKTATKCHKKRSLSFDMFNEACRVKEIVEKDCERKNNAIQRFCDNDEFFSLKLNKKNILM